MEIALKVLQIVTPVAVLGAIGAAWVRAGWEYPLQFVTRLAMTLSLPCLIFVALMEADIAPGALGQIALASLLAYLGVTLAVAAALWALGQSQRTYLHPLVFGNTGNLGLPLAFFAFGAAGLQIALVVFALMAIYSFTFGVWVVSGGRSILPALKEPIVWGAVAGFAAMLTGWTTPAAITESLRLTGQMAIPLMLITLGVAVARLEAKGLARAAAVSVAKLALCVALPWGVALAVGLDPMATAVLVVQVATPVAVTSYMLAEKYRADAQAVAALVVASTLLSVLYLPLLLGLLLPTVGG